MIKKFIDRLFGKSAPKEEGVVPGRRVEVGKEIHGIDPQLVDERAVKVVSTLADAGYEAYVVGGAVRDLLVGLRPKDFDVATNATPEQVKSLFRRAFIIGRRFRIVHVVFGRGRQDRGLSEVIEVSTFRAMLAAADAQQVSGNEKTSKSELANKSHVVDAEGRVLRDNVWGPQVDDAARRDFTVNAMYYDPVKEIVVDYHGGIQDAKKKLLRMIGDPVARYREDPVRIIRAVRFAAKLGFEIEAKSRAPIKEMAALLDNVPQSRTFDEMIKLLQTGHALASIVELKKLGLHRGVFPVLDVALDEAQRHDGREKFVRAALADTDARVEAGKPVAPSFMLAAMLWHDVLEGWTQRQADGTPTFPGPAGRDRCGLRCPHRRHLRPRQARRRHARDLDDAAAPRAPLSQLGGRLAGAAALSRRPRFPAPARRGRGGGSSARRLVGAGLPSRRRRAPAPVREPARAACPAPREKGRGTRDRTGGNRCSPRRSGEPPRPKPRVNPARRARRARPTQVRAPTRARPCASVAAAAASPPVAKRHPAHWRATKPVH